MDAWLIREARADEEPFLRAMLYEAVMWRPEHARTPLAEALAKPENAQYLAGWGRAGDTAVVAERAEQALGAAWFRLYPESSPAYGFLGADVPEVTVAVAPEARSQGAGKALLEALAARGRAQGFSALSLSVEDGNPAARLYERVGFTRVKWVEGGWTMRLELAVAA